MGTTTVEAKKGGDFFLYLCIGNGCEGWQSILDTMRGWHIALTVISILVSFFILCCCCCFCCMDDKDVKEDKKQPQVPAAVWIKQRPSDCQTNKQTNKHVMIEIRISPLLY